MPVCSYFVGIGRILVTDNESLPSLFIHMGRPTRVPENWQAHCRKLTLTKHRRCQVCKDIRLGKVLSTQK